MKENHQLHPYSLITTPIEMLDDGGTVLKQATGFLYSLQGDRPWLVTCWHVVSNRDPNKLTPHIAPKTPTHMRAKFHKRTGLNELSLIEGFQYKICINTPDGNSPIWKEHAIHRYKCDVVAIQLGSAIDEKVAIELVSQQAFQEFAPQPMDDVFVVGYPWHMTGGTPALPLFKRGSLASDPSVLNGSLDRHFIDCRTTSGMSGSPVFVSHSGIGRGKFQGAFGRFFDFLGMYSSHLEKSDELKSDVGFVWQKSAIRQVIEDGVDGTPLLGL